MRLQSLSLPQKLTSSFAIVAVLAVAVNGLVFLHGQGADAARAEADLLRNRTESARLLLPLLAERRLALQDVAADMGGDAAARLRGATLAVGDTLARLGETQASDPAEAARMARLERLDAEFRAQADALAAAPADARAAALDALDADRTMMTLAQGLRETAAESASVPVASPLRLDLLLGTALLVLAAAAFSALLTRDLGRSLRRLGEAAATLGRGDFDRAVPLTDRGDEFGRIAGAMERLRLDLTATRDAQRQASEARDRAATAAAQTDGELRREADERETVVAVLEQALTRLSAGDLSARVAEDLPERYGRLRDEFNTAVTHLGDMVGRVAGAVSSISNGTSEIGHAADDLSRRTEQQAASLDKTASALDEITATVKHSAENAASVAGAVAAARGDTERSGEVMREAVEAMTAIQKSSQQIARIIGVIDEIAFQTNLLALNAGVEAARAGDAGRGFAVVALEVRALAQRSSEAAKEIKGLIGASSTQVGNGVDLVNRSGEMLTRIAAQVMQVDALVQEIAGSTREQSIGIAEVNDAVSKMDRVTQQNAAMVQETTAATLSLRQETEELGRLVATFRVDGTEAAVRGLRDMSAAMHAAPVRAAPVAPRAASPASAPAPRAVAAPAAAAAKAPVAAEDELGWEEF